MYAVILSEVVRPLFRRLGTLIGAASAGAGLAVDVAQVEAAVILLAGVAFDLVLSHMNRLRRK